MHFISFTTSESDAIVYHGLIMKHPQKKKPRTQTTIENDRQKTEKKMFESVWPGAGVGRKYKQQWQR